ncbi:MAG TPA: alpha-ketoacid dehydrogenase subunit beta [Chloroflexi bacterium]|nr:alpha-ketoacid dehydrogenase subunit beta [Chloroflexota bacterium]
MREITYLEAVREAMTQEMERDERVFLIGEDIGEYGGAFQVSYGMLEKFGPERILDTPITELGLTGAAVGAALIGMRPIAEIMFMDFILLALDQIANQAAKMRFMFGGRLSVPMVIRMPGGSGSDAASQHSQSLESVLMHFPGLIVINPSTPYDAKGLMLAAIRDPNPVCFVEHKILYKTKGEVPEEDYTIPIGVAEIKRRGRDITVVANNIMVIKTLKVAEKLSREGIEVEVIDPRTLLPSMTSTSMPSLESFSATLRVLMTIILLATTVMSRPRRLISATPIGMV